MTYFIEIAHANDVIHDRWKPVDEFSEPSEMMEHIASPSFEWKRTDCVRVLGEYTGIFGNDECIDVGSESDVLKKHPWRFNSQAQAFAKGSSLIENWTGCYNPSWMMRAISQIIDKHTQMKFTLLLAQIALEYDGLQNKEVRDVVEGVKLYLNGELSFERLELRRSRMMDLSEYPSWQYQALSDVCLIPKSGYTSAISIYASIEAISSGQRNAEIDKGIDIREYRKYNESMYANVMREKIPFYDIAFALTK